MIKTSKFDDFEVKMRNCVRKFSVLTTTAEPPRRNTTMSVSSDDASANDDQQELHDSNTTGVSTTYQDDDASEIWELRYAELVHFQKGHGHCRVPVDSGILGKWVMHLREKYKRFLKEKRYRGQLTQERIERLQALGFEWTLRPPSVPWDDRFAQLQQFHQEHGHTRVTKSVDESFGEWVQNQRKLFRAGKLSEEKVSKLRTIDFQARIVPTNKTWEQSFELLLQFRRENGHVNVPKPVKGMEPGDEHSLRVWAQRQRTYYHSCFLEMKPSTLTKKRVKKLNDVGFDWGTSNKATWHERFAELKQYQEEHGHCNVPANYPANKALGRWVSDQKSQYNKLLKGKKSSLTMERRAALESIGFQWKTTKVISGKKKAEPLSSVEEV